MPRITGRSNSTAATTTDSKSRPREDSVGLTGALERGIEDIRTVINCRVCVQPLYEPFTIECGHTFCYRCLLQWFQKDTRKKTCPDCRAVVKKRPSPAYLIREITQIFCTRAELLPPGETTKEHGSLQEEETTAVEKDKKGQGLFPNCFRREDARIPPVIRDTADGVDRCPQCNWEMEGDECSHCDFTLSDNDDFMRHFRDASSGMETDIEAFHRGTDASLSSYDDDDDEDISSMEGFVVNGGDGGRPSPRISHPHWNTDTSDHETSSTRSQNGLPSSSSESDDESITYRFSTASRRPHPPPVSNREFLRSLIESSDDGTSPAPAPYMTTDEDQTTTRDSSPETHQSSDTDAAPRIPARSHAIRRTQARHNRAEQPPSRRPPPAVVVLSDSDEPIPLRSSRRARGRPRRATTRETSDSGDNTSAVVAPSDSTEARRQAEPSTSAAPRRRNNAPTSTSQRENLNMPGAFPPSFTYSEHGNSQPPRTQGPGAENARDVTTAATAPRNPLPSRISHVAVENTSPATNSAGSRPNRDAEKRARKAERRRMKEAREARLRNQSAPSS